MKKVLLTKEIEERFEEYQESQADLNYESKVLTAFKDSINFNTYVITTAIKIDDEDYWVGGKLFSYNIVNFCCPLSNIIECKLPKGYEIESIDFEFGINVYEFMEKYINLLPLDINLA